jgi:hypothetical protein
LTAMASFVATMTPARGGFTNHREVVCPSMRTASSGSAVARYSQGLNISTSRWPCSMLCSGTTSYYEADDFGSLAALSNTLGALKTGDRRDVY